MMLHQTYVMDTIIESIIILIELITVCYFYLQYGNLFWKGWLPEWALLIFMEKFTLKRSDAIQQLTAQAQIAHEQKYPFDLDLIE